MVNIEYQGHLNYKAEYNFLNKCVYIYKINKTQTFSLM